MTMTYPALLRPVLIAVSGALAAGFLVACGDDDGADTTDTTTTETTTTETTQTTQTTDDEGTIEIPSPSIDVPSPSVDLPEVTVTPSP